MGILRPSDPALAGRSARERAGGRAARQFGAIARWQLLELGNTSSRIDHWIRKGQLHPIHPGVYAFGRPQLGVEGSLAADLLHAGRGSALAGLSAIWWLGLLHRPPGLTYVETPRRARDRPGVRVTHRREVERLWHRELPVVPLPRALLVAASSLSHDSLRLVLARAEFAGLLQLAALEAALGRGVTGTAALRAAAGAHLPALARCANRFERSFVLLCERHRLPLPEPNARIGRYRPDMLWRGARLIVELDGSGAHSTPAQLAADGRRQAELERLGYTVLRFGWEDVGHGSARVLAAIRDRLRRGPVAPGPRRER